MDSTLRLLIVALAMLGAFLIGASAPGTWVPAGAFKQGNGIAYAVSVNTRTGKFCWSLPKSLNKITINCSKEAK
tara:strand:- start:335 stop:556 length:222 start_codon:yes stop_codon:yes gene_type:complete